MRPPEFGVSFDELPKDPRDRHEILVDLFGQYLFWIRRMAASRIRKLVESENERNNLGRLFRSVFEKAGELGPEERETAIELAETAISSFARYLLTMISNEGFDDRLGPKHVFRYRLDMEVCDLETGEVVLEETINRDGEKLLPDYWGRWTNRYGKSQSDGQAGSSQSSESK